mmetsp:Transcript_16087/g.24103  ORF Transcript_16087/g.24103 Transcript_16087/m.24103 type:complete len:124 (-) Transcript_16087:460-831(-)
MISSLISIGSFSWGFQNVRPAEVIDRIIAFAVDVITPGKGTGESSWWMKGLRNVQRGSQRIEKEMEFRSHLAEWDDSFPFLHHELIVRYAAGFLASTVALTIWDVVRSGYGGGGRNDRTRRRR